MRTRSTMAMGAVLVLEVASVCGCLVTDNPDFEHGGDVDATSAEPGTTEAGDCDPGSPHGLDCDGDMICESDRRDVDTCGSCGRSCRLLGQEVECMSTGNSFGCQGTLELPARDDAYVTDDQPSQNTEGELRLVVSATPQSHAFIGGPELELLPEFVDIGGATLCLTSLDGGDRVLGHLVMDTWSADTIDWMTQPTSAPMPSLTIDPVMGQGCVEANDLVDMWRGTSTNFGLVLVPSAAGDAEFLASESEAGPVYELSVSW